MVGFVEGRGAAAAGVDAGIRVVLVVFARARGLGAFLAEDAELLCGRGRREVSMAGGCRCARRHIPGES